MANAKVEGQESLAAQLITSEGEVEKLRDELALQRNAAANTSAAHLNETQALVKTITDEREEVKRANLIMNGFKDGVKFVLNCRVLADHRDDY